MPTRVVSSMQGSLQAAEKRCKVIGRLIARYPWMLVVPLMVLGLLLGLGILGVQGLQRTRTRENRQGAVWEAQTVAEALTADIEQATLPAQQAAQLAMDNPEASTLLPLWDRLMPALWKGAPEGSGTIVLEALGIVHRVYVGHESSMADYQMVFQEGINVMQPGTPVWMPVYKIMMSDGVSTVGPFKYWGYDGQVLIFAVPVRIPNVAANETWGYPADYPWCPPGMCYNPDTRSKLYGIVAMVLNSSPWFESNDAIAGLELNKGFKMVLTRPPTLGSNETEALTIYASPGVEQVPDHAVLKTVTAVDQEWQLYVWRGDSWDSNYNYLYAVVVIGTCIIALLLFFVVLSWAEHRALLHSVLPKEAIERMKEDARFVHAKEEDFAAIQIETPAQGILQIVNACLQGDLPPVHRLVATKDALQRSVDVYRPMATRIQEEMDKAQFVDDEVRQALAKQLAIQTSSVVEEEDDENADPDVALDTLDPKSMQLCNECVGSRGLAHSTSTDKRRCTHPAGACQERCSMSKETDVISTALDGQSKIHATLAGNSLQQILVSKHSIDSSLGDCSAHHPQWVQAVQELLSDINSIVPTLSGGQVQMKPNATYAVESPRPALLTQIESVMTTVDSWKFDAYALEEASQGRPLSVLAYWVLQQTGLITWAHINHQKLIRFLQHIEDGYREKNPYHNKRHAADVLQSMHVILHRGGLKQGYTDRCSLLACYLAAIVHDYEHRGRNNDFLVNSSDELALRYNDRSPMENHHLAAAFALLRSPDCDCLNGLSKASYNKVRKLMIDMVLATDMKQHFATLGQFDALHAGSLTEPVSLSTLREHSGSTNNDRFSNQLPTQQQQAALVPLSDTDKTLSLSMALKCADLGHLTAPLHVHLKWVSALEEEFFLQGDAERVMGLPISPLCDRTKEGVYKSQVGFFDFVAVPLFKSFVGRFRAATPLWRALNSNLRYWQEQAAQQK